MSSLNHTSMLNNIQLQLTRNYNPKYSSFESQIKQDLPYFQNQKNKNFESSNYNDSYEPNYNILKNSSFGNYNLSNGTTQNKKYMEREMEPYLDRMKKELNYIIETFKKEIGNDFSFQSIYENLKENKEDNKKLIDLFQEENNKKIGYLENKYNELYTKLDSLNDKIEIINKDTKEIKESKFESKEYDYKINEIMKKVNNIEYDNLYQNLKYNLEDYFNNLNKDIIKETQDLKLLNEEKEKQINILQTNYMGLENMNNNLMKSNLDLNKDFELLKTELSNMKILFSSEINKLERWI